MIFLDPCLNLAALSLIPPHDQNEREEWNDPLLLSVNNVRLPSVKSSHYFFLKREVIPLITKEL